MMLSLVAELTAPGGSKSPGRRSLGLQGVTIRAFINNYLSYTVLGVP